MATNAIALVQLACDREERSNDLLWYLHSSGTSRNARNSILVTLVEPFAQEALPSANLRVSGSWVKKNELSLLSHAPGVELEW